MLQLIKFGIVGVIATMTAYYLWDKVFALVFVPIYNFITRKIFLEKKLRKEDKL